MSSESAVSRQRTSDKALRERILDAAVAAFLEKGFAGTNTREIAARAKISKRELYAAFEDKQALLAEAIRLCARRMQKPLELPAVKRPEELKEVLEGWGANFLHELTRPDVVATYRLAILEAERSPQVARTLDALGREANTQTLVNLLTGAQKAGLLVKGDTREMAGKLFMLLGTHHWTVMLLLGVMRTPSAADCARCARSATQTWLQLYAAASD
jgi:AcrR family transcriptional regulator